MWGWFSSIETNFRAAAGFGGLELVKKYVEKDQVNIDSQGKNGYTALIRASKNGHEDVCAFLITQGCNLDKQNKDGNTALMLASYTGHKEICKLLITNGCNLDMQTNIGNTALMSACMKDHKEICELLITNGCNLYMQNKDGDTALTKAAWRGLFEICKLLMDSKYNSDIKDNRGLTACMKAAGLCNIKVLELLLSCGCNKNAQDDRNGFTLLMQAIVDGHEEVVELLMAHNCDLDVKDHYGFSAFMISCIHGRISTAISLIAAGCNISFESFGGKTGIAYLMKLHPADVGYVEAAIDAKRRTPEGATVLCARSREEWAASVLKRKTFHDAVRDGNIDRVRELLREGNVHIDCRDNEFNTAFTLSCYHGHIPVAILLIESGCDYSLKRLDLMDGKREVTGMYYLKKKHPTKVKEVQAAIDATAVASAKKMKESDFCHAATLGQKEELVEFLDEGNVNIDCRGVFGETALINAASSGHKDIVDLLITRRCNLDICNDRGETAFIKSCVKGYVSSAILLIESGCDFTLRDTRGKTGMDYLKEEDASPLQNKIESRRTRNISGKEFRIKGGVVTDSIPFVSTTREKNDPLFDGIWSGTLNNLNLDLEVIVKENARARNICEEALIFDHLQSPKGNTGCIHMYGFDEQQPPSFIVVERFGINLHTKLALERNMDILKKRLIMKNILQAVASLHGLGVMHGDIKPQNILVNEDKVKLCDLDSARIIHGNKIFAFDADTKKLKCSPSWVSPEVYAASNASSGGVAEASLAIDMFSVGLIVALLEDRGNHFPGGIVLPPCDSGDYHRALTDQAYLYDVVLHLDNNAVFHDIISGMCSLIPGTRPTSADVYRVVETKTSLTAHTDLARNAKSENDFLQEQVISRLVNITDILHQFGDTMTELVTSNKDVEALLHQVGDQVAYMSDAQSQEITNLREEIKQATATLRDLPDSIQSGILEQIAVTNQKINTILQDTWRIPMLVVVLKTSKNRVFRDDYALHFLCEHTLQLAPCGPAGEGFQFKQLKAKYARVFKKIAPVLMIGLVMLKIAVSVYGIPLPLPELKDLSTDAAIKVINDTIIDLDVDDTNTKIQEIARSSDPRQIIGQYSITTEQQREAYESLQQFLDKDEYKPHKFGLVKVTCEKSGVTKWIKEDQIESFLSNEGRPVYKI